MANDSTTGGYLAPEDAPAPAEDADLDALFQAAVRDVTGLPGALVRPRWQPTMPKQPEPSVNWCALAVTLITPDDGPAIEHLPQGDGAEQVVRHEELEVLTTFYGPQAQGFAARLRDGISLPQNMEALQTSAIGLTEVGRIRTAPELVNQQWIRRCDLVLYFRRKVTRVYPIRHIVAADVHLIDDTHIDELITVPPAP